MITADTADLWLAFAEGIRPPERLQPSEWARRYRRLKPGTTSKPGRWTSAIFPYLDAIMDSVDDAMRDGKRGLALMKSGQGGGSEAMLNVVGWLRSTYSGGVLYLISKDDLAREFGRERIGYMVRTAEPLARKHLGGRARGELLNVKRFTDGKIAIYGGRSVLNLESLPWPFVIIDEIDSLANEITDKGDLIKTAQIRTDACPNPDETLIVVFAHPTTREQGAGRAYYELSDQCRGFIDCPHCADEFWLQWQHVKADDERDAATYRYHTPCCGAVLSDTQRAMAVRGVRQKSTLPPEVAAKRRWRGVHFSQLYMPNKTIEELAADYIDGLDEPSKMRVFVNKKLGDVFDTEIEATDLDTWRRCCALPSSAEDPWTYRKGSLPKAGPSFLVMGQDSRSTELHWLVLGAGLVEDDNDHRHLMLWVVDWGVETRPHKPSLDVADLRAFDDHYRRGWSTADGKQALRLQQGWHDCGWQPTAVYDYAKTKLRRAVPCRGGQADSRSTRQLVTWISAPRYTAAGKLYRDDSVQVAELNTHRAKEDLFALPTQAVTVQGRDLPRVHLPMDVDDELLQHFTSERLVQDGRRQLWKSRGPNHWLDCLVYAYAAARNWSPFLQGRTQDEITETHSRPAPERRPAPRTKTPDGRPYYAHRR